MQKSLDRGHLFWRPSLKWLPTPSRAKSEMALYPNICVIVYSMRVPNACIIKRTIRPYFVTYRLHYITSCEYLGNVQLPRTALDLLVFKDI